MRAAVLVLLVLLLWAALAQVDEVTRGDARVIPSRQLQVVQSLDGGIVSEIKVREGEIVEAGETEEVYRNPQHPYTKRLIDSSLTLRQELTGSR